MSSLLTESAEFPKRRKVISQTFFKSKMEGLARIIIRETLDELKQLKDGQIVDLPVFTQKLYSRIAITFLVGRKNAKKTIPFEQDDGSNKDVNICLGVQKCMQFYFAQRVTNPFFIFFPFLLPYTFFTRKDARYGRNNDSVNNAIMEMVRERKAAGKEPNEEADVLDMLLSDELYHGNDLKVANDIRGLFLAGDETCNVTTSNFLYYMAMHPEYRARVLSEIMPTMSEASSDFVHKLSPNVVDEFLFTKQCVYETLRICPSGPQTMPSMFNQDVTIGGVDFKAHKTSFIINMQAIMMDPKQWIRPREFNPERFNP